MKLAGGIIRRNKQRRDDEPSVPSQQNGRTSDDATWRMSSSSHSAIFVQDVDGRVVLSSNSLADFSEAASPDAIERSLAGIGEDHRMMPSVEGMRRKVLTTKESAYTELRSSSGPCYSLSVIPLLSDDGELGGTLTMLMDITEQKELERLQEEGEIFRRAIESVRDPVYVKDLEGRYTMANASVKRTMGKDLTDVIGRTDLEIMEDMQDALTIMENDRKVMRSGKEEMFEEHVKLSDGAHTFLSDKTPNRNREGRITGIIGISRDITERKHMEEADKAKVRWLESILESAPVAIGVSRGGHILYANPLYLKLFGYHSLEDVKGRSIIEQIAPEDRGKAVAFFTKVDEGRSSNREKELMGIRRDGSRFPFQMAIAHAELPDGPALLGFFTDITERRKLESGLEESRRTADLYIDILTHDISNYNAAAIGYLQLADMNLELDEEERGFISRSLQVLADSSELIANIRDLQNIESGRDRPEPLDVCSMLKEITDAYRSPMDRKVSISLTTHGGCMVHASMLLRGAFSNLISNAIKHSTGAVDIHITVIDYYHYGEKMVRIDVSDNGPGIADERKGVIFDRSLMGLTRPVSRGLGLYLVKRLVENYGGEVWVEDRIPGDHTQGARFVVLLPAAM